MKTYRDSEGNEVAKCDECGLPMPAGLVLNTGEAICEDCEDHGPTEDGVSTMLQELIAEFGAREDEDKELPVNDPWYEAETYDFCHSGLLTRNKGFVLNLGKHEFQITIVRSK